MIEHPQDWIEICEDLFLRDLMFQLNHPNEWEELLLKEVGE